MRLKIRFGRCLGELSEANGYSAFVTRITDPRNDLLKGLELVDWKKVIRKDSRVFIKPNFAFPYHKEGVTTSPAFLRSLIGVIKEKTNNVILGESDGGNRSFSANDAFRGHDMYKICTEVGVHLVNLSKQPYVFIEGEIQGRRVKVQLPKLLLEEVDCLISIPVLKLHYMTGVSLGIKNLWGCYPDTMRNIRHKNLSHKLALMTKLLKPRLEIIDATYALDVHGPRFGQPRKTDLAIFSNNVVVADSLGAAIIGIPLSDVEHILIAEKEGLGTTNLRGVRINEDWEKFKMKFRMKRTLVDRLSVLLSNNECLAGIVMNSRLTPLVYVVARFLRTPEERRVAREIERYHL